MRRWLILLPLALILSLATTALAQKTITPTRLADPIDIHEYSVTSTEPTGCLLGNLNAPYYSITGWLVGQEEYKYLFYPWDACDCPLGFWLQTVHIYLLCTEEIQYPYEFEAFVDLEDALWDDAIGCWVPGIEDCVSPPYLITIPGPGLYDIGMPIGDFCDCAFMDYWYFLSVHFVGEIMADLVTDDMPTPCTVYNNWGAGWIDLYSQGFDTIGNVVIYGEAVCCDVPVDVRKNSWGEVKALYR